MKRRNFVISLGPALTLPLSGCTDSSNSEENHTDTHSSTTTTPLATGEPTAQRGTEPEPTASPEPETPASYRADRKRIASTDAEIQNVGSYSTDQSWDDLVTITEEIQQAQQNWNNQQAYTPLVDQVMNGEDFKAGGKIFPNWEREDDGYFDQDVVKNEDDFETIIRWYLPAIKHYDRENHGYAPSSRHNRFAETMETLINEHHPKAEAQATSINSLPGHGIFGVQDKNNEEFYLVDTTAASQFDQTVGKIGDFITSEDGNRSELWDPFHDFQPGETEMLYETKSEKGVAGLMTFASTSFNGDNFDSMFITDEWMDDAYEVLRNGGSIQPIVEPIEDIVYNAPQLEEKTRIGIYGTLEDTRIAVSSGDMIYEKVMYQPEPQSIDDIESMLAAS